MDFIIVDWENQIKTKWYLSAWRFHLAMQSVNSC